MELLTPLALGALVWAPVVVVVVARSSRAASRSRQRAASLVLQHPDPVYELDRDGRFVTVNDACSEATGLHRDELLALESFAPLVVADDLPDVQRRFLDALAGRLQHYEARVHHADGGTRVVEIVNVPIVIGGRVTGVHAIARDVTEERRRVRDLVEATERLAESDRLKTTFLRAVSHELRTPLTAAHGLVSTVLAHPDRLDRELQATMLRRAVAQTARLQRMVGDLLDVDRLTRGAVTAERRRVDLARLVGSVLEVIDTSRGPVRVTVPSGTVELDGPKVERIVENLVANAQKYTPDGTPVHVWAELAEDGCLLAVDDEGPGIPEEERDRIFDAFAQGEGAATAAQPGTGIGLSLVRDFAALHGGRAWVEDAPGGGAGFRVWLPGATVTDEALRVAASPAYAAG